MKNITEAKKCLLKESFQKTSHPLSLISHFARTKSSAAHFANARISAAIDTKVSSAADPNVASASAANAPANRDSPETTADARRQTTPASHPTENCATIKDNASAEHAGKRKRESNYRGPTCEDCPTCSFNKLSYL